MKVAVSGAAGRMGKRILALAAEHPDMEISGALENEHSPALGKDAGETAGIGALGIQVSNDLDAVLEACDILIEFSAPAASLEHAQAAAAKGKAIVVGTTGFSEEQKQELVKVAGSTRLLLAPNMSRGVNLLFNIAEKVATVLGSDYDVEIIEAHHKMKKDAPSGTADKLAQIIAGSLGRDLSHVGVYGRKGIVGERKQEEIGVFAVRGGDIVGDHTVMFITNGERIELTHRAHSRDALASGAIQAALWLISQPNGMYDMQDVLGLKA
jgi:4-hydroxy-tetrahydrodipicolinate reductase